MSYQIHHDAFKRRPRHGLPVNDNIAYPLCIEVYDAVSGWQVHMDYAGEVRVLGSRLAGQMAWQIFQSEPHLRDVGVVLSESVKRIRTYEGVI